MDVRGPTRTALQAAIWKQTTSIDSDFSCFGFLGITSQSRPVHPGRGSQESLPCQFKDLPLPVHQPDASSPSSPLQVCPVFRSPARSSEFDFSGPRFFRPERREAMMKVEVDVVLGLGSRTERGFSGGRIKISFSRVRQVETEPERSTCLC